MNQNTDSIYSDVLRAADLIRTNALFHSFENEQMAVDYLTALTPFQLVDLMNHNDIGLRAYSYGIVMVGMGVTNKGELYVIDVPRPFAKAVLEKGDEIKEFLQRCPPLWTRAQTCVAWCFPAPDDAISASVSLNLQRWNTLWKVSVRDGPISRTTLDGVKSLVGPIHTRVAKSCEYLGLWDTVMTPEEVIEKMNKERKAYDEADAMSKVSGSVVTFNYNFTQVKMKYQDGRDSYHYFIVWPDGQTRCDCEWKRWNWDKQCKHEKLRDKAMGIAKVNQ